MIRKLYISHKRLAIEDIIDISLKQVDVCFNPDKNLQDRLKRGADFLDNLLEAHQEFGGRTVDYSESVTHQASRELIKQLPVNLTRLLGCALGETLNVPITRAILATKLVSLTRGYSGVTLPLLQQLINFLSHDIMPLIPQEGSVGASYLAAALIGEGEVYYNGCVRPTHEVLSELGIKPIQLRPKEVFAIMCGTAVMTALACIAFSRAEYLTKLCSRTTALVSLAIKGNKCHFDEDLFAAKLHPGLQRVAARIRKDLNFSEAIEFPNRLHEHYSISCAPHVIGVLEDALSHFRIIIENELNSANDNPLFDSTKEKFLYGGHFYGGHIAYVADALKTLVANLADLMDRQLALLIDTRYNNGLTLNLTFPESTDMSINHGFKAVQIGASAWTTEALMNCMPGSVFSRSTECNIQDKVSMGTIAARSCIRVIELTEQVQAALLLASVQALIIRRCIEPETKLTMSTEVDGFIKSILNDFELVKEDRPLESDLRRFVSYIQEKRWKFVDPPTENIVAFKKERSGVSSET